MTITPDDAQQILDLKVDGKANETESVLEKKDGRLTKKFNLKKLRDTLSGTKKIFDTEGRLNPVRINATASAYLLHVLEKCIFPESSGSLVDASYMELLDPLDKVLGYSWGTPVVAFLNNDLTKCSRALTAQVNGNTCLFQVWIYEPFPSLFKTNSYVKVDANVAVDKPRAQRYSFKGTQDKEIPQNLIKLRIAIEKLTADDVIFDLYRDDRNQGLIQRRDEIALYYGTLLCSPGYSMYDPHQVIRQLGYIQEEPHFDEEKTFFTLLKDDCSTSQKTISVPYFPPPSLEHWNGRRGCNIDVSLLDEVTTDNEVSERYMAWYLGWAHPTMLREMTAEELARKRKMASKDPAASLKFFQLEAEVKMEEKARREAQAKLNGDKKRARSGRGGEGLWDLFSYFRQKVLDF
ncbi:protein MAINTENANCE OF MERISTEMS-like [Papaver somniferum]|uniref:protein MAINTENANCE OF MERISTEMS-like n=1 Tax=Papaver somniferum TaxID=3469 RepID=UPI000E6F9E43|nr:protein MAINTENANCE OF MERISTEMS-like [Papaver somniferum]